MATNQSITTSGQPDVKSINYIGKTFGEFKQNLISFAKSYYPNTYSDFNEASPGMMFIEMASYLGEVLSFYIDNSFKENLLAYAEQRENVITIAQFLGYKPKLSSSASTKLLMYQLAPAILVSGQWVPDPKYLVRIGKGSIFSTAGQSPVQFRLIEDVDFRDITAVDFTVNTLSGGNPQTFIVTKEGEVTANVEKTTTFTFNDPERFASVTLIDENIVGIVNVEDSDKNKWYEVNYLSEDVILDDTAVTTNSETGLLPLAAVRLRKVPRRFVTRINRDSQLELIFGSGTENGVELNMTLDSRQVANKQYGNVIENILGNVAIDNTNFLNSYAYGIAPSNTTLTVTYLVGGGVESNVNSNSINRITKLNVLNDTTGYNTIEQTAFSAAVQSITVNNSLPATGGGTGDTIEEIKQNALGFFNAQGRVVTAEDYAIRTYSLPPKYGKIAKAFAIRDEQLNRIAELSDVNYVENPAKPNCINLYTLGFDRNGNLSTLNTVVKNNLAKYLEAYRLLTDDVNILDAFIINIGVRYEISVLPNYNRSDVLTRCTGVIQNFFSIDKWSINQPIILTDLSFVIGNVEGVRSVRSLEIFNKYRSKDGLNYQNYRYNISSATVDGVVYPSLDPSIFELKYPETDIIGTAAQ
jgi:hypothetical protein